MLYVIMYSYSIWEKNYDVRKVVSNCQFYIETEYSFYSFSRRIIVVLYVTKCNYFKKLFKIAACLIVIGIMLNEAVERLGKIIKLVCELPKAAILALIKNKIVIVEQNL